MKVTIAVQATTKMVDGSKLTRYAIEMKAESADLPEPVTKLIVRSVPSPTTNHALIRAVQAGLEALKRIDFEELVLETNSQYLYGVFGNKAKANKDAIFELMQTIRAIRNFDNIILSEDVAKFRFLSAACAEEV